MRQEYLRDLDRASPGANPGANPDECLRTARTGYRSGYLGARWARARERHGPNMGCIIDLRNLLLYRVSPIRERTGSRIPAHAWWQTAWVVVLGFSTRIEESRPCASICCSRAATSSTSLPATTGSW